MPTMSGRRSCAANFRASLQVGDKEVEVKLQAVNKERAGEFRVQAASGSVSRCRAARRQPPSKRARRMRKPCARASRAAIKACASPWRFRDVAVRETITRQSADLGGAATQDAQQYRYRPPDAARHHAAGGRGVCRVQQDGCHRRHARQAQGPRRNVQRAISGAVEEVPQSSCAARR